VLRSVEDLLRSLYTKQYSEIYRLLTQTQWTPTLSPLAQRFREHFSAKTYQLVSKTFVTITPESAAHYLGVEGSKEEVVETLVGKGWTWDAESGLLKPKKAEESGLQAATYRSSASDARLGELVELIAHLTQS
jgi:COP9 signalosome complex subunit 8